MVNAGFTTSTASVKPDTNNPARWYGIIRLQRPAGLVSNEIWRSEQTYSTARSAEDHAEKHLMAVLTTIFAGSLE